MDYITLTEEETLFLKKQWFNITSSYIRWKYYFSGYFENWLLVPWYKNMNFYIKDNYEIEIYKINWEYCIKEVWKKIPKTINNHIHSDWWCCLWVFSNKNIDIFELFNNRLFSYFYASSFKQKFWYYPYWELAHWPEWVFQAIYYENDTTKCVIIFQNYLSLEQKQKYLNDNNIKFSNKDATKWYEKFKNIYKKQPLFNKV
jgi:hypothetical protein